MIRVNCTATGYQLCRLPQACCSCTHAALAGVDSGAHANIGNSTCANAERSHPADDSRAAAESCAMLARDSYNPLPQIYVSSWTATVYKPKRVPDQLPRVHDIC